VTAPTLSADIGYDPFAPEVIADPNPWYRRLNELDAPYWCEPRKLWVLARYEHVRAAARNAEQLSSAEGVSYMRLGLPMLITTDPPDHTRLRRLVARDFTPRAIEQWRATIDRLVAAHVPPFVAGGGGDWIEAVAEPFPVLVIADILGVPASDFEQFKVWSEDLVAAFGLADQVEPDAAELLAAMESIRGMTEYFGELAERRRREPGDDFISRLVAHGDAISDAEVRWMCLLLLVAGNETTTNLLGSLVAALLEHPDAWARLRADPGLVPVAVEEALRHDSPIQGLFRTAAVDVECAGAHIARGSRVLLLYAAANRDPAHVDDPDAFRLDRGDLEHVGFSSGPHHCLGAHLARMETAAALRALIDAGVTSLAAAGEVVRTTNPTLRGVRELPLSVEVA
jgi:cytochrome P450